MLNTICWDDEEVTPTDECWQIAQDTISYEKVRWAIDSFQPYKTAGLDGIIPALLQWGSDVMIRTLTTILEACLAHR